MTDNVLTRKSIVAIAEETVEGTYEVPLASEVLCVNGIPNPTPERELLNRELIKGSIGMKAPEKGLKTGQFELNVEARGGGVTATVSDEPDYHLLLKGLFGSTSQGTNSTTDTGSTSTVIELTGGGGAGFAVNQLILVGGEARFILSIATDSLTLNAPLLNTPPGTGIDVFGGVSYAPASEGHISISATLFQDAKNPTTGPEFRAIGCKLLNMNLLDWTVGQIPKLTFTLQMLDFAEVIGTSPATPVFNTQAPNVVINALFQKDDVALAISTLEMSFEHTIEPEPDWNAEGGNARLFIGVREVTGSINPFMSQTSVALPDAWNDNTDVELFGVVGRKDSSGLLIQGSVVAIWLPQNKLTTNDREDSNGSMRRIFGYMATESDLTTPDDDVFMGVV